MRPTAIAPVQVLAADATTAATSRGSAGTIALCVRIRRCGVSLPTTVRRVGVSVALPRRPYVPATGSAGSSGPRPLEVEARPVPTRAIRDRRHERRHAAHDFAGGEPLLIHTRYAHSHRSEAIR